MEPNIILEIWQKKSLIIQFAINDVKLRYKNSFLGFLWSFLEPLLMLAVLYFVFTNIMKTDIENYPIFLLLGLIFWYMFSRATSQGQSSLLIRAPIIKKINIRHEFFVISSCLSAFFMMAFEFAAFVVFLVALQFVPGITIIFLPLLLLDLFILSLGFAFMLSVVSVYFRDVQFIWQIILQAGFFLSPVIYTLDMFPENIRWILELNPLVAILDTAHDITLYNTLPDVDTIIRMMGSALIMLVIGYAIFRIKDKKIAEEL